MTLRPHFPFLSCTAILLATPGLAQAEGQPSGGGSPLDMAIPLVLLLALFAAFILLLRERRRTRGELLSLGDLKHYFDTSKDLLCIASLEGRLLRVNPAWEHILGYSRRDLEGSHYMDLVHPDDVEETAIAAEKLTRGEFVTGFINRCRGSNGEYRYIEWDSAPLSGKIYASARDITEWTLAQDQLRESEQRFRTLLDTIETVSVQGYGADGTVRYWNAASETVYGYARQEALGKNLVDLIIPEAMKEDVRQAITEMARTGQALPASELTLRHQDGSPVQVFSSHAVVRTASGETMLFCLDLDLAPLKLAEAAVSRSEKLLRTVVENAGDAIFLADMSGRFLEVNPEAEHQTGYSRQELLGMGVLDLDVNMTEEKLALFTSDLPLALRKTFETVHRTRDGGLLPVEIRVVSLESGGTQLLLGLCRDISSRKRTEETLSEAYRVLATVLDSVPAEVSAVDLRTHEVLFMNRMMKQTFRHDRTGELCYNAFRGYTSPCDNCPFPSLLDSRGEPGASVAWEDYNPLSGKWYINHDKAVRWLDGRMARVQVALDITERKRSEQAMAKSLKEKELLLREIHHRVKNNLQIISSLLSLQEGSVEHPETHSALADSIHRVFSMAAIHEQLYNSGDFTAIDVKSYLETLLPRLVGSFRGERNIRLALEAAPCKLTLEQAIPYGLIMNELATNAFKHGFQGRDEGVLCVSVRFELGNVATVVENDGQCLPEDFDPHSTQTLGMQLVGTLVNQLGGVISAQGSAGARFAFSFPASPVE